MKRIVKDGVIYRLQRPEDLVELAKLLKEVSDEEAPISARSVDIMSAIANFFKIQQDMKRKKRVSIVAEVNGKIVGNATIKKMNGRLNKVGNIGILIKKEYRNRGIGTNLMKLLLKEAKKIGIEIATLEVVADNKPAIRVYEKMKFKEFGKLPKSIQFGKKMKDIIYMYRRI